jgi:hypothetical protein
MPVIGTGLRDKGQFDAKSAIARFEAQHGEGSYARAVETSRATKAARAAAEALSREQAAGGGGPMMEAPVPLPNPSSPVQAGMSSESSADRRQRLLNAVGKYIGGLDQSKFKDEAIIKNAGRGVLSIPYESLPDSLQQEIHTLTGLEVYESIFQPSMSGYSNHSIYFEDNRIRVITDGNEYVQRDAFEMAAKMLQNNERLAGHTRVFRATEKVTTQEFIKGLQASEARRARDAAERYAADAERLLKVERAAAAPAKAAKAAEEGITDKSSRKNIIGAINAILKPKGKRIAEGTTVKKPELLAYYKKVAAGGT